MGMNYGTLIVSLDFELFWGMRDVARLSDYQDHILGGKKAIPSMLEIFQKHGIHATWAAVGFMFAESADQLKQYLPQPDRRPTYEKHELSPYDHTDEVNADPECYFAPSLLRQIGSVSGQEIGSHTFSHYYCREAGQTVDQFEADMTAAKKIAQDAGYDVTSVVFPRNQSNPDYISVLKKLGFTAYRSEEDDWIHKKISPRPLKRAFRLADVYLPLTGEGGYHPKANDGIVDFIGSRMYKPYFKPLAFLEKLKIRRIKKQMLHAAEKGLTFHLWWHPHNVGVRTEYHMKQLEEIFSYYDKLKEKYGMRSLNMKEAAEEYIRNR